MAEAEEGGEPLASVAEAEDADSAVLEAASQDRNIVRALS